MRAGILELAEMVKCIPSLDETGQFKRQFLPQLKSTDTFLGGFIEFGPKLDSFERNQLHSSNFESKKSPVQDVLAW